MASAQSVRRCFNPHTECIRCEDYIPAVSLISRLSFSPHTWIGIAGETGDKPDIFLRSNFHIPSILPGGIRYHAFSLRCRMTTGVNLEAQSPIKKAKFQHVAGLRRDGDLADLVATSCGCTDYGTGTRTNVHPTHSAWKGKAH